MRHNITWAAICICVIATLPFSAGCIEIRDMLQNDNSNDNSAGNVNDNANMNLNDNGANENDNGDPTGPEPPENENGNTNENGNDNGDDVGNENDNADDNANANDNENANENDNASDNENENENDNGSDDEGVPPLPDGAELTTTASGLQYYDFEVGNGDTPMIDSRVRVMYVGYLEDGAIFDSSDDATFGLDGVIDGFAEGISTMNVGGRRRLVIPPDLGYGPGGNPGAGIGGEDTIIFDVTLLSIVEL